MNEILKEATLSQFQLLLSRIGALAATNEDFIIEPVTSLLPPGSVYECNFNGEIWPETTIDVVLKLFGVDPLDARSLLSSNVKIEGAVYSQFKDGGTGIWDFTVFPNKQDAKYPITYYKEINLFAPRPEEWEEFQFHFEINPLLFHGIQNPDSAVLVIQSSQGREVHRGYEAYKGVLSRANMRISEVLSIMKLPGQLTL